MFPDVLRLADVDEVLTSAVRRPEVRLVRAGEPVAADGWSTTTRLGGRWCEGVADPVAVGRELHDGATVVLQSLHRTVPSVGRFAAALEARVSHPVQVNAYLTPPGAAGLAPHADGHDVIAVQLHGTKSWAVDGLGEVELQPGDCLYLPAGTRHSASTGERSSLHLTIGIIRITARAALRRLLERSDDPALDAPLPLGYAATKTAGDELTRSLRAALDAATDSFASADAEALADHERARRRPRLRHEGHLASLVRLDELDHDTLVQLRPGPPVTIDRTGDDRMRVHVGDRILHLPAAAGPALERLATGSPCRVGDLPGLNASSQEVVARRLVVEGVLTVADHGRTAIWGSW